MGKKNKYEMTEYDKEKYIQVTLFEKVNFEQRADNGSRYILYPEKLHYSQQKG